MSACGIGCASRAIMAVAGSAITAMGPWWLAVISNYAMLAQASPNLARPGCGDDTICGQAGMLTDAATFVKRHFTRRATG